MPSPPVNLIIRFPSSLPDLPLLIPSPSTTTALHLNQLIRPHLPPTVSTSRLRLISSGAVLPPTAPISSSLRIPTPPPPPPTPKANGKSPIHDPPPRTLYIHCSLADALSPAELAEEAALAVASIAAKPTPLSTAAGSNDGAASLAPAPAGSSPTTTTPPPRGFDRLLAAGLTPPEIAALRSQFLALQAHTHTPDTMPSAAEMRLLEDRWLDNGSGNAADAAANIEGGFEDEGAEGGLDDILWGNVMGFFWPVGAVVWGFREEGVWSKRRQIAVLTGVLVNVGFSVLRVTANRMLGG